MSQVPTRLWGSNARRECSLHSASMCGNTSLLFCQTEMREKSSNSKKKKMLRSYWSIASKPLMDECVYAEIKLCKISREQAHFATHYQKQFVSCCVISVRNSENSWLFTVKIFNRSFINSSRSFPRLVGHDYEVTQPDEMRNTTKKFF